ncbi:PRC-barrel domain containing protein [Rhizobium vallis]|uniref:PRC-barrel domain containing protein n=1 Tax=Rhizobium vallis TaxID=634290 RepID=A0A432PHL1_9HYPH|nr:PRC-barrel domain-containing protein [Rhizobium vallis]RUM23890.1 PRC-barrel domain containing protein [Rhizobium vallis]
MLSYDHAPHSDAQAIQCFQSAWRVSRRAVSSSMLAIAMLSASGNPSARAQTVQLVTVDVQAVSQGFQVSKLIGKRVENDKNEKIGTLDDLVIAKDRNLFAILEIGGFLGLGGYLVAVPYESLTISDDGGKITLAGASKDALQKLPEFQFKK